MRKKVAISVLLFAVSSVLPSLSAKSFGQPFSLLAQAAETVSPAPADTASSPQWASVFPADTAFVLAVEDAESLAAILFPPDPSKAVLPSLDSIVEVISELEPKSRSSAEAAAKSARSVLSSFTGSFAFGVSLIDNSPAAFLTANLKPEAADLRRFLSQTVQPFLTSLGVKSTVQEDRGVIRVQMGDFSLNFTSSGTKLFASTRPDLLVQMTEGKISPDSTLASQPAFRKAIALVPPNGVFFYARLHAFALLFPKLASGGTPKALANLGLAELESLAVAASLDASSLNLTFALTNSGEFTGLPAIASRPNTSTHAAKFVPPDYSLFKRFSTAGALDAYREWQATVRRMVDDVTWKEYLDTLINIKEQQGFSLLKVLEILGDEVAFAVKFPELLGIPPCLLMVSVKDEVRALDLVHRALKGVGVEPTALESAEGPTIYATSLIPKVLLSYAAKDGYLVFGLAPQSVARALQTSTSGKSLAEEPSFARALDAAPKENLVFAYADIQSLSNFALGLYLEIVKSQLELSLKAGIPLGGKTSRSQKAFEALAQATLESRPMGPLVFYATSGKDSLSAKLTVPVELITTFSTIAQKGLARSVTEARQKALRANCMNNLKQIAAACHMYSADHDGKFPEKLSQLHSYVGSLSTFVCPVTRTTISRPEDIDSMSSYKLIGGLVVKDVKNPGEKLVLYESIENHKGGANAAFADGHVEWVSPDRLQELLKQSGL